nr:amidophosphoribosyltransferase [Methanophagales archaeon]
MCGIVGIALEDVSARAAIPIFYALYSLQHRGQESAGIATVSGTAGAGSVGGSGEIHLERGMGLVSEVFRENLSKLKGNIGIGHVRYSTTGASTLKNAEPLVVDYRDGRIAIAHNGNIVNASQLRNELKKEGRIFHSETDTEVLAHIFVKGLMKHNDPISALEEVMRRVIGSYSLTMLVNDTLIAVRDPVGFRPLCMGFIEGEKDANGVIFASESTAIDTLGGITLRDVRPGEVIIVREGCEYESFQFCKATNKAHCVFEYIYFARPDSVLDGRLVYDVRLKIGERLAEEHPVDADIVSPIPDSGVTFAIGYAKRSSIDYIEAFIKNRYVGRTFIMPEREARETAVRLKLNVVRENVASKRVILVDDSIVRGTTSKRIVERVRRAGAKEVHLRIGSPPIKAPCYFGIDTPTREELIASSHSINEICSILNADSIGYLSIEGLIDAIGMPAENLCLGCLTGKYPVEVPGEECIAKQLKLWQF